MAETGMEISKITETFFIIFFKTFIMKTKKSFIILTVTVVSVIFASCNGGLNETEDPFDISDLEKSEILDSLTCSGCTFSGELTEAEIDGLMEMREEEKLAGDVYSYFYEEYSQLVFSNISKSETAHKNAVLYLINGYGLTDPTPAEIGTFANPLFNELYAQLTEQGSTGLVEALKTGAFIEEYDIADLERLLVETQNEDVLRVYGHLLNGSKNHLRAFSRILNNLGESYTATVITEEHYMEILAETPTFGYTNNTGSYGTCIY